MAGGMVVPACRNAGGSLARGEVRAHEAPGKERGSLPKMVGVAMEGDQAGFSMNHGSAMRRPSSSRWLGW